MVVEGLIIQGVHNALVVIQIGQDNRLRHSLGAGAGNNILIIGQGNTDGLGNVRHISTFHDVINHSFRVNKDVLALGQSIVQLQAKSGINIVLFVGIACNNLIEHRRIHAVNGGRKILPEEINTILAGYLLEGKRIVNLQAHNIIQGNFRMHSGSITQDADHQRTGGCNVNIVTFDTWGPVTRDPSIGECNQHHAKPNGQKCR